MNLILSAVIIGVCILIGCSWIANELRSVRAELFHLRNSSKLNQTEEVK